jgi:hypothetical protein
MFDDHRGDITQRRLQRTLQKNLLLKTTLDLCQTSNNKKCNYNNSNIVTFEYEVYVLGWQKKKEPYILALRAIEGAKKVSAPFGRLDFHCPPLQMGRVMGFPA